MDISIGSHYQERDPDTMSKTTPKPTSPTGTTTPPPLPSPLPGKCYAELKPETEALKDGIWIPESAGGRRRIGFIGTVVAETPKKGCLRGTVGRRCLFATWGGQRLHWHGRDLVVYDLTLEHFVAVYYGDFWVPLKDGAEGHVEAPGEDAGIHRCRYCKSKGQGNILLDGDLVCHKCGRHADGRKHVKYRHKKSDGTEFTSDVQIPDNDDVMDMMSEADRPKKARGMVFTTGK